MSKKSNLIFVLLSLWKVKLLEREKNKKIQLKLKKSFCMNYLKQGRTVGKLTNFSYLYNFGMIRSRTKK